MQPSEVFKEREDTVAFEVCGFDSRVEEAAEGRNSGPVGDLPPYVEVTRP